MRSERCLRKYSIIVLLKAVETTNLLQHNESGLSGAMKALGRRCNSRAVVVCSLIAFISVLNDVVCQAQLCFYMAKMQLATQSVTQTLLLVQELRGHLNMF